MTKALQEAIANEIDASASSNDRRLHLRKKFLRNLKDYGPWISFKKSIAYVIQPLYKNIIYHLYELDLSKYDQRANQDSKYAFKLITPDEVGLIRQIEEMEEWLKGSFQEKLKRHCLCMVVLDGDEVIGFNYVAVGEAYIPLLNLRIITGPTEAWSEQITVSKDYRRQGLGSQLRSHFYQELKKRGITALYGHRQEFNVASRQSARKFTAGVMVRAEYRRILWMHRLTCTKSIAQTPEGIKRFGIERLNAGRSASSSNASQDAAPLFAARIEDLK